MKKHILIPAVSICLLCLCISACTEDSIDTLEVSQSFTELTITATMEEAEPSTKTGVITNESGKKSVIWSAGDAISLFFNSGDNGGSRFVTEDSGTKATFSGSISSISGDLSELGNKAFFWGLYPYNENASCNGTSIFTTLPSEQIGVPDTFADSTAITVGRSENLAISFKNTNTIFAFKVAHDNIRRVKMYGNNGEKISGNYSVSFDNDGKVVVTPAEDALDYVSVTPAEGTYFIPDTWYYIVTLPVVFSGGYSMDFDTITERATYTTTDTKTFKVSTFYTLTNKDSGLEFSPRNENVPFEDANFKAYCVQNFDTDGDGEISMSEAQEVQEISVFTENILSLRGIEYFPNLINLFCPGSGVSYNYELGRYVGNGQLTNLDVSKNLALKSITCYSNQLLSLDVSNNKALEFLYCSTNKIDSLDMSNNPGLLVLLCQQNQISSLDVSMNSAMSILQCYENQLTSFDVNNNTALIIFDCHNNQLTSLDVSNNTALISLSCYSNQLNSLDVSNNTALTSLQCLLNQLTSLDVSNNTALETLYCSSNLLTSLDISKNTALNTLFCNDNQLTSLDVSNNTALTTLTCEGNQLTSLDISNNTALTSLGCANNQLTSLDVSNNTELTSLDCGSNQLTNLDVSKNTALTSIDCGSNHLTFLDVSKNTALTDLGCYSNQLTSLDVSKNTALTDLICLFNQLTSLNISSNTALTYLDCKFNQLTSLDVSKCTALSYLYCSPMIDFSTGNNTLASLYISEGQNIPYVTDNRNPNYIPEETIIRFVPNDDDSPLEDPKDGGEWGWN